MYQFSKEWKLTKLILKSLVCLHYQKLQSLKPNQQKEIYAPKKLEAIDHISNFNME